MYYGWGLQLTALRLLACGINYTVTVISGYCIYWYQILEQDTTVNDKSNAGCFDPEVHVQGKTSGRNILHLILISVTVVPCSRIGTNAFSTQL